MAVLLEACYLQMTAIQRKRLINVAHAYCCKWRLKVVVFARELVEGSWNWALPRLST